MNSFHLSILQQAGFAETWSCADRLYAFFSDGAPGNLSLNTILF